MRPYRILVTGWRDWPELYAFVIGQALDDAQWRAWTRGHQAIVVVHGACEYGGVDEYADRWALRREDASVERHPAERGPRGQILGPARNSRMVAAGADECLAFPGPYSKGTWDCMRKVVDANIRIRLVAYSAESEAAWGRELGIGPA